MKTLAKQHLRVQIKHLVLRFSVSQNKGGELLWEITRLLGNRPRKGPLKLLSF